MLEEVILALSGHKCWLVNEGEAWTDPAALKSILGLHPGEGELLGRLLTLGHSVARLETRFGQNNDSSLLLFLNLQLGNISDQSKSGFYRVAFSLGVQRVLSDYRSKLCELERQIRSDVSKRNLMFLAAEIQPYFIVFDVLNNLSDKLHSESIRGCQLLSLVVNDINNYVPEVKTELCKIRISLARVFANQLVEWLNYGHVDDQYNEFFVNDQQNDPSSKEPLAPMEIFLKENYKPAFISDFLCEKICFIGQKMKLVRLEDDQFNDEDFRKTIDTTCCTLRDILLAEDFDSPLLNGPIETLRRNLSRKLWDSITTPHEGLANDSLFQVLDDVRNYYFLGKGELFLTLIDEFESYNRNNAQKCLENGENKQHERIRMLKNEEMNKMLQKSFSRYTAESCAVSSNINSDRLGVATNDSNTVFMKFDLAKCQPTDQTEYFYLWKALDIKLDVGLRLRPIFSNTTISQCEAVFRFLFKVRFVLTNLHKCWLQLLKGSKSELSGNTFCHKLWKMTNSMLFFVNNLHFYLQVDTVDGLCKNLCEHLRHKTDDYQKAKILVDEFIRSIRISCFLESKEISKMIDDLLDNCLQMSSLILNWTEASSRRKENQYDNEELVQNVNELSVAYQRRSSLLFKILSNPKMHLSNPHLAQLLQRLDMNSFFSSSSLF